MQINEIHVDGVRDEQKDDKDWLVAPVTAMKAMVLDGGYVPAEHVKKSQLAWNGEPVTLNHPRTADGVLTSANSPDIAEKTVLGRFYNVTYDEDSTELSGEIWLDVDKSLTMGGEAEQLINDLRDERAVSVSTAYFGDELPPGEYDGEHYQNVVGYIRPDHLAMLPNEEGKCSVDDGCMAGVPAVNIARVNAEMDEEGSQADISENTSESRESELIEDEQDNERDTNMEPEEHGERAGEAFINKLRNTLGIDMTTRDDMIDVLVNDHDFKEDSLDGMGDTCLQRTYESFNEEDEESEMSEEEQTDEEHEVEEQTDDTSVEDEEEDEILSEIKAMKEEMMTPDDVKEMIAANEQKETRQELVDEIVANSEEYDEEALAETPIPVLENIRDDVTEPEPVANFAGQRGAAANSSDNEDFPVLSVHGGDE